MVAPAKQRSDTVLEVTDLRKVFNTRRGGRRRSVVAVDDVSFTVRAGSALAIVGESGSGKTTIARMLMGLEQPTAGRILIDGVDRTVSRRRAAARRARAREIQIVFQDPYSSLDRRQTVQDCIEEVLRVHFDLDSAQRRERIDTLGSLVGLDQRQLRARPRALSGGQRQRAAIARALAAEPNVLILDESLASLDVSIQAQVLNQLADIRARTGVTYLLISHNLAVVRQSTDQVIVMRAGSVVERGDTGAVLDNPQSEYTRVLRDSVPRPGWHPRLTRSMLSPQDEAE